MSPLPIDPYLPEIARLVRERRALVVTAPPGAGKTTRVPPALLDAGPAILLQPRRVAARALARRIAAERGWRLGEEIGWQVRFERRYSPRTRLLVATEGILTARLQEDPLLAGFATVILDEFHERTIHADLALALTRQAAEARRDLRIVVMSATLDAGPVAAFLGNCPVVEVPGRPYPVDISFTPGRAPADAVRDVLSGAGGDVLCFLPGASEIARVARELHASPRGALVLPLHGSLDADAQDLALAPSARRKVILATNIAETSLTVEGVETVVDSGLHRVLRADDTIGIDRLETERISRDAADQRAGRAGRLGPGRAIRLWDPREQIRPQREPEIERVDLAAPLLDVFAWGADPRMFAWFEPPPEDRILAAIVLLERIGAVAAGRITDTGRSLRRFPLHPRLARVMLEAGGSREAAAACAILSERWPLRDADTATTCDLLPRIDHLREAPSAVRRAAEELHAAARRILGEVEERGEASLRRALWTGYADRLARRREPGSSRLLLVSGHGAVLGRESGVRDAEFVVVLDVTAGVRGPGSEALVRAASAVDQEWIGPERKEIVHFLDRGSGSVRAMERAMYGAIVLAEQPVPPDRDEAGRIVAEALFARGLGPPGEALRRRLRFAGLEADLPGLVRGACVGATRLPDLDLAKLLPSATAVQLKRSAPTSITLPSGREARLDYREDGAVVCAAKLQELFGLAETPRLGPYREPVVFELLAPNGRPVQTTRDLRSFWETTYSEVRKELRGRYPRHPWPDDPWAARPTHRAKPRGS